MVREVLSGKSRNKALAFISAAVVPTLLVWLLWPSADGESTKRNARVEVAFSRLASEADLAAIDGNQTVWWGVTWNLDLADIEYMTEDETRELLLRAVQAIRSFQERAGPQPFPMQRELKFWPESSLFYMMDSAQNYVRVRTFLESLGFTNLPYPISPGLTPTPKSTPEIVPLS